MEGPSKSTDKLVADYSCILGRKYRNETQHGGDTGRRKDKESVRYTPPHPVVNPYLDSAYNFGLSISTCFVEYWCQNQETNKAMDGTMANQFCTIASKIPQFYHNPIPNMANVIITGQKIGKKREKDGE